MSAGEGPSRGRPAWVIPLLIIAVVLLAGGLVFWLVASNDDDSADGGPDSETALVIDMSEAEIRQLQSDLTTLGHYDGPINGIYNEKTVTAVEDFQRDAGLQADGIAGPDTLAAIDERMGRTGSTTTPASTTAPPSGSSTEPPPTTAPEGPNVELSIAGGAPVEFLVTLCINPNESTLTLEAETEGDETPTKLELEAVDGTGTITLTGPNEAGGTVDQLMVGDTGEITATGEITEADDSATPQPYELTGDCL